MGAQGLEGTGARVGSWTQLDLTSNVKPVTGFEEASVRPESGGATARMRGVLVVTNTIQAGETVFTIPACCRPKSKIETGMNTTTSKGENHVGTLQISPTGVVTDPKTPVPVGVWYLLDDTTWNLT